MEWKEVVMSDIIDEISMGPFGSDVKKEFYTETGVPILNGSNLQGFKLNEDSFGFVSEEKANSLKKSLAKIGDVIVTHRGTLGQIVYVPDNCKYDKYLISQSQFRFRLKQDVALPQFVVYYFHTREGQHRLLSNASQVGVPALARASTTFRLLNIPLPSIEEQKKIVSILSSLDAKIENNNKINAKLEEMAQALFKSWFIDFEPFKVGSDGSRPAFGSGKFVESELGMIPEGWKVGKLDEYCFTITKGTTPSSIGKAFTEKGIPFIKVESISENHIIDNSKISFIDDDTNQLLSRSQIKQNDILFTIAGTLGRFAINFDNFALANTNQAVAIVRLDPEKLSPLIFYTYLLGNWHNEYCRKNIQQAVQANLSLTTLKNMPIIIADKKSLNIYLKIVEPLLKQIFINNKENSNLARTRDTLLPKLMSGEIEL